MPPTPPEFITCRRVSNYSEMEHEGDYFTLESGGRTIVIIKCPYCQTNYEIGTPNALGIINHTIDCLEPLTVSPSVVNPEKGCHFWIKGGLITKA